MNNFCVITTINKPTKSIDAWFERFHDKLIIVGDKKTDNDSYRDFFYINPNTPPFNHYARKNFGYLQAMRRGAELIYDTDDDNSPSRTWAIRESKTTITHTSNGKWCNVYEPLTSGLIWPRGFPLKLVTEPAQLTEILCKKESSIQQGLANLSPDVDAIWRLTNNRLVSFWVKKDIWLKDVWCPFNSQSTWWFPKAFPLMYLPMTASFRMTDIYRSFVAQKCLWELGEGIIFHSPSEVLQDRNEHDLLKDFEDEVHGYLNVEKIVDLFSGMTLAKGEENICGNMFTLYNALVANKILKEQEMPFLKAWVKEYENITADMG